MIIAVEYGLEKISKQLRKRGYTLVSYPEYKGIVDAFIYKEDMISGINQYQNNMMADTLESHGFNESKGILIINAHNKNIDQIEEILKNRIYSPLF